MTIFDNLVNNENSLTELFKNYFSYDIFRKDFIKLIDLFPSEIIIEYENLTTQQNSNNCRPDMRIRSEDVEIFIEIKVWDTSLTDNQPVGYLNELMRINKKYKGLVLIVPDNYKHLTEYLKRQSEYGFSIPSKIIYWSQIITFLEKESYFSDSILQEFLKLLTEWFIPKKINIDSDFELLMNNNQTPESILKLINLIDGLNQELTKRGVVTTKKRNFLEEYGFYVEHQNFNLFVGEWFHFWQKTGQPLCLSLETDNNHIKEIFLEKALEFAADVPTYYNVTWFTIGFPINVGYQAQALTDCIYTLIRSLENYKETFESYD